MPDFRLSLLDADEHLDIKINRFGIISTTPMWKAYFTRGWIVLEAKVLGFRWVQKLRCLSST